MLSNDMFFDLNMKISTMKHVFIVLMLIASFGCKEQQTKTLSAQNIVDNSINVSGGDVIAASTIKFNFRDKAYVAIRNKGAFQLERKFKDTSSPSVMVRDVLSNTGFQRFVDGEHIKVQDSMVERYSASVNSVHYFSVLPYGLNDKAVNKELLGKVTIKNKSYHTVKVSFDRNGGGEDFEDVFLYWIDPETSKVDYLAYSYNEDDGKGLRFREAYNERYQEGVRFVDYNNYKPNDSRVTLMDLPELFNKGELKLLSKIELENISVSTN